MKVLVLDDDKLVLDVTSSMIERLGHKVIRCSTGKELLENYDNTVNCVVIDYNLSVEDGTGRDIADKIKGLDPNALILFITGQIPNTFFTGKNENVLYKPYSLKDLRDYFQSIQD